jgi:predicted small integral membrane protein
MTKSAFEYIQILMVASIALFFTLVAYDNFIDYNSNWLFVKHVLSMDTTFRDPVILYRAITQPSTQTFAYNMIIAWQVLTACACWLGCLFMWAADTKTMALIGLFMGFLLYMVGFLIIGGEWFSMWQSASWNGQEKAGIFLSFILLTMIFICFNE